METIFPRKVTVRITGKDGEVISEATQKTWLTRGQLSEIIRIEIEDNDELRENAAKVEII